MRATPRSGIKEQQLLVYKYSWKKSLEVPHRLPNVAGTLHSDQVDIIEGDGDALGQMDASSSLLKYVGL